MRLISVRFGNVLASNGSVVPKFKRADRGGRAGHRHPSRHGALFHDHPAKPAILVSHRSSHAGSISSAARKSVYVLNMGQPVKIVDLAERIGQAQRSGARTT